MLARLTRNKSFEMNMLGHDGDKSGDANLKGKHLEREALLVVRLSPRHLPVDQPDGNVLVDLPIIWVITIICISNIYNLHPHISFISSKKYHFWPCWVWRWRSSWGWLLWLKPSSAPGISRYSWKVHFFVFVFEIAMIMKSIFLYIWDHNDDKTWNEDHHHGNLR